MQRKHLNNAVSAGTLRKQIATVEQALEAERKQRAAERKARALAALQDLIPQAGQLLYHTLPCGCEIRNIVQATAITPDGIWISYGQASLATGCDDPGCTGNAAAIKIHANDPVNRATGFASFVFQQDAWKKKVSKGGNVYWVRRGVR